jgi:predicted NAD/FAD-binding protein
MNSSQRIAIIGSGISGISSAHLLQKKFSVSLFEKDSRLGGHTNTITLSSGPDAGTPVDTGFIVFNDRTYPNFIRLLSEWGVSSQASDMSFSYWDRETDFCYAGTNLNGLFAKRRHLFSAQYWHFLKEITLFNKAALDDLRLRPRELEDMTLAHYVEKLGLSTNFKRWYLWPMAAAIWSASQELIDQFPASTFLHFFRNHGLLELKNRPLWRTIQGGSHSYIKAFEKSFSGQINREEAAVKIIRHSQKIEILTSQNRRHFFDFAVLACHADDALSLIESPTKLEKKLLGAWSYSKNRTFLHTDLSFMPKRRAAWASWNYVSDAQEKLGNSVTLTYDMNRLQNLKTKQRYLVTLNPTREIPQEHLITEILYTHPQYTLEALQSQKQLHEIQGVDRLYFAGAHFGFGFHEDGAKSGFEIARRLGALPG